MLSVITESLRSRLCVAVITAAKWKETLKLPSKEAEDLTHHARVSIGCAAAAANKR